MARDRTGATTRNRGLLALLPVVLLAGCADADFAPFGRGGTAAPPDSLTVRRVMGQEIETPPLLPEPGNVWPSAESPRATLANPDGVDPAVSPPRQTEPVERARDRGLPPEPRLQSTQPRSAVPPEVAPNPRAPLNRRGSSTPPGVLEPLDPAPLPRAGVPVGAAPTPPSRGVEGRVIPIPGGPPGIVSGGSDRVQSFMQPGVGTGTAINDGRTTTLIGPDGRVTVVPR